MNFSKNGKFVLVLILGFVLIGCSKAPVGPTVSVFEKVDVPMTSYKAATYSFSYPAAWKYVDYGMDMQLRTFRPAPGGDESPLLSVTKKSQYPDIPDTDHCYIDTGKESFTNSNGITFSISYQKPSTNPICKSSMAVLDAEILSDDLNDVHMEYAYHSNDQKQYDENLLKTILFSVTKNKP